MESQTPKAPQFDAAREFVVPVVSAGEKRCVVRFPTDDQWIDWSNKRKTVVHALGRNKTQSEVVNAPAVNAELLAKIRIDKDGPELDPAEATAVIERLHRIRVISADREGNEYRIRMQVPGAIVEHVLKMPLRGDVDAYVDASVKTLSGRRSMEQRIKLEPVAPLWDKIVTSTSGYAGAIPVIHKEAAVDELVAQLRSLEDDLDDLPEA